MYKIILLLLFTVFNLSATIRYWKAASTSTWATGGSWSGAAVPTSGDTVIFDGDSSTADCNVSANTSTISQIVVRPNYTGTIATTGNYIILVAAADGTPVSINGENAISLGGVTSYFTLRTAVNGRDGLFGRIKLTGTGALIIGTVAATNTFTMGDTVTTNRGFIGGSTASGTNRLNFHMSNKVWVGTHVGIWKNSAAGVQNNHWYLDTGKIITGNFSIANNGTGVDTIHGGFGEIHVKSYFADTLYTFRTADSSKVYLDSSVILKSYGYPFNKLFSFPVNVGRDSIVNDTIVYNYFEKDSSGSFYFGTKNQRCLGDSITYSGSGNIYANDASTNLSLTRKTTIRIDNTGSTLFDSLNVLSDSSLALLSDSNINIRSLKIPDACSLTIKSGSKLSINHYTAGDINGINGTRASIISSVAGLACFLSLPTGTNLPYTEFRDVKIRAGYVVACTTCCANLGGNDSILFNDIYHYSYLSGSEQAHPRIDSTSSDTVTEFGVNDTVYGRGFFYPCSVSYNKSSWYVANYIDTVKCWYNVPRISGGTKTLYIKNADYQIDSLASALYIVKSKTGNNRIGVSVGTGL